MCSGFNFLGRKNGAQDRDRTSDTAIFSRMLYQLSYLGTAALRRERAFIPAWGEIKSSFLIYFRVIVFFVFRAGLAGYAVCA